MDNANRSPEDPSEDGTDQGATPSTPGLWGRLIRNPGAWATVGLVAVTLTTACVLHADRDSPQLPAAPAGLVKLEPAQNAAPNASLAEQFCKDMGHQGLWQLTEPEEIKTLMTEHRREIRSGHCAFVSDGGEVRLLCKSRGANIYDLRHVEDPSMIQAAFCLKKTD